MAENQTAAEDSGQQSTQHQTHPHHNQQQQQQQQQHSHNDNSQTLSTQNSEEISSALASPTTPPNENNSASSPDEPQTIVIANHHQQQQINQAQQQTQQQQERSMIDRQVTTKIKTIRRNTIQTTTVPVRATSTTSIKKASLTKMNSLTGSAGNGEKNTTEKHHLQQQQQQQLHHHHHHHQHNSMTNHHHHHHHNHQNNTSPPSGTNSNSTAIHRTTSESLRLNAIPPSSGGNAGGGGGGVGDILSNATSNSSIHSNLTNNSSSSASVAPKSTSTNASHSKSTTSKSSSASSKATSPNNNNSIASATAGSSHASRSHHSHGHIPGHGHGHVAASVRKPKTTSSFQITSVTVGHPKAPVSASDNGEEESADDLDESHTDDNSRITDLENETPSMSEDTFSKEEIYYHQDDALSSTAPVIPTSSQYGLVVATLGAQDISNVQVNVGENFINVVPSGSGMKKEDLKDSAQHRSERFKVVKIESTEPFRRGRWVCMDYLDHTSVSGKEDGGSGAAGNNNEKTETGGAVDNGEHAPKTTQSMILGPGAAAAMENHIEPSSAPTADGNWNFPDTTGNLGGGGTSTAPATVMHGIQQFVETAEGVDHQTQIMQQEPQYQTPPQEVNANATPQMTMSAQAPPDVVPMDYATVAAQKLKKSLEELKKQEEAIAASEKAAAAAGGVYMPGQSQPVNFEAMQQQQQVPIQQTQQVALQQQQQQQHASTLPGNINIQNGNISIATDNNNVVQPPQQQAHSLGYNIETTQQPMSPAPQQIQVPPSFVTASFQGTPQQTPPQQSPQMQEAGQPMQQHPQQPQQQMNTQSMQQVPPQQPAPTQLQQQSSQTDGVVNVKNTAVLNNMQQMQQQQQPHAQAVQQQLPPQFQQLQQQQQPLVPGQTMPILTQMTSYDMQQQQHPVQHQQSAPATMLDNSALLATLQQQQQQQQQQSSTTTMAGSANIIMQPATGSAPSQYQQQQQQQPQLPIDSAPPTSVSANSSNSTVNLNPISTATMIPITSNAPLTTTNIVSSNNNNNNNTTPNIDNQTIMQQQQQMQPPQQQQQPSTSSQLQTTQQQLQQNTETETERNVSSLTHAMSTNNEMNQVNNRKRAFSTPYITAYDQQMLINSVAGSQLPQFLATPSAMGGSNEQNIYFYNKSSSGRSSFCVDESMWPNGHASRFINNNPPLMQQLGSDTNIYTNLALGNERYKLPVEFTTSVSPAVSITTKRIGENDDDIDDLLNENEEDLEESTDQFSPLLYPATQQRSQPIAISAGNSPVHKPKSAITKHLTSGQKSPKRNPSPIGNQRQPMAFSASPTGGIFPYSPFYGGSPETAQSNTTPQKVSFSYDPSFGANIHHLPLPQGQQQQQQQQQEGQPLQQPKQLPRQPPPPQQRHSQPSTGSQLKSPMQRFSTGSIESAPGAILYASSPTSSLTNSASGTSAVAIDNKIEQAMDLVKSHLMIAVREEVEVLKEKISELMDKINQLEVENTILKANMSQETLQQLQMQTQLQIAGSAPTSGSNMITGAPTPAAITAAAPTTAAPTSAAAAAVANAAVNASSNSSTAAATPQSNVGSGTATPTTQQPTAAAATVEQNVETTQVINAATTDDSQSSAQATNGPMS